MKKLRLTQPLLQPLNDVHPLVEYRQDQHRLPFALLSENVVALKSADLQAFYHLVEWF